MAASSRSPARSTRSIPSRVRPASAPPSRVPRSSTCARQCDIGQRQLRGGRRRGGPHVSDEIGERDVGSCPTAEMVGTRTAASARHTASALNAERSSRPPPPRPTMQHSISAIRFTNPSARTSASTALPPCTRASTTSRRAEGHRRRATVMMSCSAAPSVLVTTATVPASGGSARFRAASNSPSWCSRALTRSSSRCAWPIDAVGSRRVTLSWNSPFASYRLGFPSTKTSVPSAGGLPARTA